MTWRFNTAAAPFDVGRAPQQAWTDQWNVAGSASTFLLWVPGVNGDHPPLGGYLSAGSTLVRPVVVWAPGLQLRPAPYVNGTYLGYSPTWWRVTTPASALSGVTGHTPCVTVSQVTAIERLSEAWDGSEEW